MAQCRDRRAVLAGRGVGGVEASVDEPGECLGGKFEVYVGRVRAGVKGHAVR